MFGPLTRAAMEKYTPQVQELIEDLKRIPVEDLWNVLTGKSSDPVKVAQVMQGYFIILQEINRQREVAKDFTQTKTPDSASQIDNKKVYFLDINFMKYWSLLQKKRNYDEMNNETRAIMRYDVILMLYFPKMTRPETPTPGDSEEEDDFHAQLE